MKNVGETAIRWNEKKLMRISQHTSSYGDYGRQNLKINSSNPASELVNKT